jgi:hypothetical protein
VDPSESSSDGEAENPHEDLARAKGDRASEIRMVPYTMNTIDDGIEDRLLDRDHFEPSEEPFNMESNEGTDGSSSRSTPVIGS